MAIELRSVDEIPNDYRYIFAQFANFNRMQSKVMNDVFYSDKSLVVTAPTGSGKTVILELAIIRLLIQMSDAECNKDFRIVYMAPIKALCNEMTADWKTKFERMGLSCRSVTGDDPDSDLYKSKDKIIITTPEKFDSLSRKWHSCIEYMNAIKLFMIDEVHLLNENKRGPILETVVSRMRTIRTKLNEQHNLTDTIRFVAVSATIPNIIDLASWLCKEEICYHKISEDLRPVQLEKHVLGYPNNRQLTAFRFDMNLTYKLPSIINQYSSGKPVLIFCNSRRSTEMGAVTIFDKIKLNMSDEQRQNLAIMSNLCQDSKLIKTISKGIGFHHAGLCVSDRKLVEDKFRLGFLPILFSTNTLAMGVNLPAFLVIIKSTEMIIPGGSRELSETVLLQMIGRAGRPQFDIHGVAVIMTQNEKVKKYENLISGTAPIESHLQNYLVEHLNSEIVSETISNMDLVIQWIRSTYLYIRAIQNPAHYGLPENAKQSFVEKKLEDLCVNAIEKLVQYGLVTIEDSSMKTSSLGRLMAHYYLSFATMKHFKKITGSENVQQMFEILISCPEYFNGYHLRVEDKRILNELNRGSTNELIRFPIQGKIKNVTDKISCMMQAVLGNITITDQALNEEAAQMMKLGQRMGRALQEYITILDNKNKFSAMVSIMLLQKALHVNLWENSPYIFKQCKKIGHVYSKVFESKGKTKFESVLNSKPSDIEMMLKKHPPFGTEFLDAISVLPQYSLSMEFKDGHVHIIAKQINQKFVFDAMFKGLTLIIGDQMNEMLLINHNIEYCLIRHGTYERKIALKNPSPTVTGHLIHNTIVGLDKTSEVCLRPQNPIPVMDQHEPKPKISRKKSVLKGRKKQQKISDYINSSKTKQKRSNNFVSVNEIARKKARNYVGWDYDLLIPNDIIDMSEQTDRNDFHLDNLTEDATETSNSIGNKNALKGIQTFNRPKKKTFTLKQPSLSLKEFLSESLYEDITSKSSVRSYCEDITEKDSQLNCNRTDLNKIQIGATIKRRKTPFKFILPKDTKNVNIIRSHSTETNCNDPITNIEREKLVESNMVSSGLNLQNRTEHSALLVNHKNKKNSVFKIANDCNYLNDGDNTHSIISKQIEAFNGNHEQNSFAPSCIKATFRKRTPVLPFYNVPIQHKGRNQKDIKFSYNHLLTPIRSTNYTYDSPIRSLQATIYEHQTPRTIALRNSSAPLFSLDDQYTKHFCAAEELEKMKLVNLMQEKRNNIFLLSSESNQNMPFDQLQELQELSEKKTLLSERIRKEAAVISQKGLQAKNQSNWIHLQWNDTSIPIIQNSQNKLMNVDPLENNSCEMDFSLNSNDWFTANRFQCINSTAINQNVYDHTVSQSSSFLPNW